MAMNVKFLKGLSSNLPTTLEESTLYFCTDGKLYLGSNLIADVTTLDQDQVNELVAAALENFYTKEQVDAAIKVVSDNLADYALKSELEAGLANKENVGVAEDLVTAAKSELQGKIDLKLDASSYNTDKATFATKEELNGVDAKFANYRTSVDQDVIDNDIKATMASDKEELEGKINLKVAQADFNSTVEDLNTAIAGKVAQADYNAKVAELAQDIADAEQAAKDYSDDKLSKVVDQYLTGDGAKETIDTLVEIVDWINSDTAGVAQIISDVATNKQAIADEKAARELADTNINSDIDAIEAQLSGIAAGNGAVKAAIDAALQAAKDYADENDADTQYNDTEVRNLIAANTQAIANALAEAKKYADDNDADTIYDDTALAGRVTAIEGKEATWNGKQDALTTAQLAAVNSGITATKVGQYDNEVGAKEIANSKATLADVAGVGYELKANLKALAYKESLTAAEVGADAAGSAATVQGNVDALSQTVAENAQTCTNNFNTIVEHLTWGTFE